MKFPVYQRGFNEAAASNAAEMLSGEMSCASSTMSFNEAAASNAAEIRGEELIHEPYNHPLQ